MFSLHADLDNLENPTQGGRWITAEQVNIRFRIHFVEFLFLSHIFMFDHLMLKILNLKGIESMYKQRFGPSRSPNFKSFKWLQKSISEEER